jgi:hypothetical protein
VPLHFSRTHHTTHRYLTGEQHTAVSIYYEPWGPAYGTPYQVDDDPDAVDDNSGYLVEDGEQLVFHDCPERSITQTRLALTDGVRRIDAWLYHQDEATGQVTRGLVGTYGVGAVVIDGAGRAAFDRLAVERVVVWGGGRTDALPPARGNYGWRVVSHPGLQPDAPVHGLQNAMGEHEKGLAESLSDAGWMVVTDGTLDAMRTRNRNVVGYVKTHHRPLLPPEEHRRVSQLRAQQRTSVFQVSDYRYSCYFRLQAPGPADGPWHGIVRLEVPASPGLAAGIDAIDYAAGLLPRFAGIAWRDPRAPQNLQPIGALESHLRRLMGDQALTNRAAREAIAQLHSYPFRPSTTTLSTAIGART